MRFEPSWSLASPETAPLNGGNGNDFLSGGAATDTINGTTPATTGARARRLQQAERGEGADFIVGSSGADTAYGDAGLDPATIAVERVIPR